MASAHDQPLAKLLSILSPTINLLETKGNLEVSELPQEHLDSIKQLERLGIVHRRNNRIYELQKIRLKKLMDNLGLQVIPAPPPAVESESSSEATVTVTVTTTSSQV